MSELKGIINVIKPPAMSSFAVVKWIKKTLDVKKAGHTGTLDPKAAGVLPICLNRATKIIPYLPEESKEYYGELRLGITTDTLDSEGEIVEKNNNWKDTPINKIKKVFYSFKGNINQIPPMYSAVHYKGERLYKLARQGKNIERKPRKVNIKEIKILTINLPFVRFKVRCSKGTYIRSLVRDIGEKLEVGSYLTFLLRTRSGPFKLENSNTLPEIEKQKGIVIPMDTHLPYLTLTINKNAYKKAINGNILKKNDFKDWSSDLKEKKPISIYDPEGNFLSINEIILKSDEIICKPRRVFT